jgi:fibronectin-binding autotransporter adhesin
MKPKFASIAFTSFIICFSQTNAADITWDNSDTAGIQGGDGNWTTTDTNWTIDDGSTRTGWNNATWSGDSALFSTGSGTVSLSGTLSLFELAITSSAESTIGGIATSVYRFNGGTLNFGAAQGSIDTMSSGLRNSQINSNLTGTGGLRIAATGVASGQGRLVLNGDNTSLSGGIAITSGLVSFTSASAAGGNLITLDGGGIFGATNHSGIGATLVTGTDQILANGIALTATSGNTLRVWGGRSLILTGTIAGAGGFNKTDSGNLLLAGASTFSGPVSVLAGTLTATSLNSVSGGTSFSALGTPANALDATIALSGGGSQAALSYLGTGESSDRVIHFASGAGGIITQHGTGPLNLTSDMTGSAAAMGIIINGGGVGTMSGITNTTALLNFNKQGLGRWTVNGTLTLNGGNIRLQGGILDFSASSSTTGDAIIGVANSGRTNGGILRLQTGSSIKTASANTNGILGGWATFDSSTWAVANGSGSAITGLATFTTDVWAVANNTNVTLAGADPASDSTTHSLRFNEAGAKTLTLGGTNTVVSGGLLVTTNVGANATTITGGTLVGANTTDLVVHQTNSGGDLTISSVIANNTGATGLTKTGAGTLVLSGVNTYTGTTRVFEGKLTVNANSGGKLNEVAAGATLELGYGTGNSVYGYGVTVNGAGVTATTGLYLKGGNTYTLQGALRLAGSPSTVRTYETGDATLAGWDTNGTHMIVENTASGSVIADTVQYAPGGYGYVMNIAPGLNNINGDVTLQGPLTGAVNGNGTHFRKVGHGSVRITGSGTNAAPLQVRQGTAILSGGDNRLGSGSSVRLGEGADSGLLILDGINQTLAGLTVAGTGTTNRVVGGSTTLSTLEISNSAASTMAANLGGPQSNQNNLALTKSNTGTLTVSGANTHTGGTTITEGTLSLASAGALGTSGTISMNGGTLQFSASNTTDYTASGRLKLEDGAISSFDTNDLDITFGSPFALGTLGSAGLGKTGAGNLTLAAAQSFTGETAVNAGVLTLDYTITNSSKLSDTAALTLAGGTLRLSGGSHQEIVSDTFVSGNSVIERSSGNAVIHLGAISRSGTSTLSIAAGGIAKTSLANDLSGKLPSWITVNGSPAANDGSGNIITYSAFVDVNRLGGKLPNNPAANVRIVNGGTTGDITPLSTGQTDISTLLQNANAGPAVVTLSGSDTLRLGATGAVIVPVGSGDLTIRGGLLTAGGGADADGEIAIDADEDVVISSPIVNNGAGFVSLTKSGSAALTLTEVNDFSGGTILTDGELRINHALALGLGSLAINGGSLDNTSGAAISISDTIPQTWNANLNFIGSSDLAFSSGDVTLTADQTATVANGTLAIGGALNGAFTLTKAGAGTLSLAGGAWSGLTTVNAGTLEILGKAGDVSYLVNSGATLMLGYSTGGGYANTNLKVHGDGTTATTGLYFRGGASYNGSGTIELLTAPTTIRHYGSGLASIGTFDINGTALRSVEATSGSVIDANIQFISRGYGMSVEIIPGAATATGDLVMNGPLNVGDLGLYKRGAGSLALNAAASPTNTAVRIQMGSVITGIADAIGANAELQVSSGAKLSLNGFSQASGTLSGAGQILNGSATPVTLTVTQATTQTFSGILGGAGADDGNFSLVKAGTFTLTLTGANNYSGSTTVNQGTLSISNAFLADSADVVIASTAVLDLTTGVTDTIDQLIVDGTPVAPGVYGAIGSGAQFERSYITGNGTLTVTTGSANGYDEWEIANGIAGAGAASDSDGDGIPNGIEFVIGGDPSGPNSNSNNLLPVITTDATYLNFVFRRTDASAAYDPFVEYSSSLTGWDAAEHGVDGVIINEEDEFHGTGIDRVTVKIPRALASGAKLFARLRVEITP